MNYSRDLERIQRFIRQARASAWGPKLIPVSGARKVYITYMSLKLSGLMECLQVKVPVGGGGQVDEDGNSTQGGRVLELVVDGEEVFIVC